MPTPLRSLFGPAAVSAEAVPGIVDGQLFPEELAYIRGAVAARRSEYGTSRLCARRALAALGLPPVPLVPDGNGAPSWPTGIVGSISHTRNSCAVVVASNPPVRSLGLDIEPLRSLDAGVEKIILTPRELWFLRAQPRAWQDALAMCFFSAKEAYYKCQYLLTGAVLDFQDVELDMHPESGRFEARALRPQFPTCAGRLGGRFVYSSGMVMCGVELLA
jgi:4'-phosphopantetheinyl transferase EntD